MDAFATIVPIFMLIGIGVFARQRGFIPEEFLGPANRLTYYFAIPALLFRSVSRASLKDEFQATVLLTTLAASFLVYFSFWLFCKFRRVPAMRAGAMVQSAAHGNLGYIGLPFAFYFLGEGGLIKAGILAGFLMILQNVLSVTVLQSFAENKTGRGVGAQLLSNPVILSSLAGILVSASGFQLPQFLARTLDMLGGMAPPMALLLIGASLSFRAMFEQRQRILLSLVGKLLLLPAVGLLLYLLAGLPPVDFLPGLILLACPTATIAYLMAREMGSDGDFVVAAISASTLLSALSFLLWLNLIPLVVG